MMADRKEMDGVARDLGQIVASPSAALKRLAARCDAMCLTAGIDLGHAVPGLYDLSGRFASLSATLVHEEGVKPAESLDLVASRILLIGAALVNEHEAVTTLIKINETLSRRIDELNDSVRFLSAIVSNVKIEIATIDEDEMRLEGFAENLKQLASKSESTVTTFRATHENLVRQLHRTERAQSAFVTSHGGKFMTASQEIRSSLESVSARRRTVGGIADEVGAITQRIGTQIAQCVVALQIGDSSRQRLEHVGEALAITADPSSGSDPDDVSDDRVSFEEICQLEAIQTQQATTEFALELTTIASSINTIVDSSAALIDRSRSLVSSPRDATRSFLTELEQKLAFAGDLLDGCGRSRKLVDETAERVVASIHDLQGLAKDVAAMATDMMIIGTNAVVTSYRLGNKGIPLSVIAQHLRDHAMKVADAVQLVSSTLTQVLNATTTFTSTREGQDAASMESLALSVSEALAAFRASDSDLAEARNRLESEVSAVRGLLLRANEALLEVDPVKAELASVAVDLQEFGESARDLPRSPSFAPALVARLRGLYTMGSERQIHDTFWSNGPLAARDKPSKPSTVSQTDDCFAFEEL